MSHHDRYDSGHAKHKPEFRELSKEEKHLVSRSEARRLLEQTEDLAVKAKTMALDARINHLTEALRRISTLSSRPAHERRLLDYEEIALAALKP